MAFSSADHYVQLPRLSCKMAQNGPKRPKWKWIFSQIVMVSYSSLIYYSSRFVSLLLIFYVLSVVRRLFLANCLNRVVIINHPLLQATLKTHWLKMTHTLLFCVCHPHWLCYPFLKRITILQECVPVESLPSFPPFLFLSFLLFLLTTFEQQLKRFSHCLWIIFLLARLVFLFVNSSLNWISYVIRRSEGKKASFHFGKSNRGSVIWKNHFCERKCYFWKGKREEMNSKIFDFYRWKIRCLFHKIPGCCTTWVRPFLCGFSTLPPPGSKPRPCVENTLDI